MIKNFKNIKDKIYTNNHSFSSQNIKYVSLIGLNQKNVYNISKLRKEPKQILDFRLKGFQSWRTLNEPTWSNKKYTIDYNKIHVLSSPRKESLTEKQEVKKVFERLNISLDERESLNKAAIDAVIDSESVYTSHHEYLKSFGVIYCSISEAITNYFDLIAPYLGSVVPHDDNYFSCINTSFFSDGTFVYIPKNVEVPIDLSSYFRIESTIASQFERTLIVAEEGSKVNYLEGCSAPYSKINQLHCAVVELIAKKNAKINYFTLQNWFSGDDNGCGGVYNFVTKRGICHENAEINWIQAELGSKITWKYPSCILEGNNSRGSFFSISLTDKHMMTDTGTKMIHIGQNTKSSICSKTIVLNNCDNTLRSRVKIHKNAINSQCFSSCDTMFVGINGKNDTFPSFEVYNSNSKIQHESKVFNIDIEQDFFLGIYGYNTLSVQQLLAGCFAKDILNMFPLEFQTEIQPLLELKFENG